MSKRLEGKAALVTGGSKGIGKGIAKVFLDEGASVFLCARSEDELAQTARELSSHGEVSFLAADVADPGDAERLGLRAVETFPHLSILLNNASILGKRQAIEDVDIDTWDDVLRVNTSSLFYVTKPLVPHFAGRGDGSIINVSSSVGRRGKPNWGPYAVSKFGLEGFTQVLAAELDPRGVRVNSVNPGATRTDMRASAYPDEDPTTLPAPEEIAEIFVFLASDESKTTTGQAFEARDYLKKTWS
ncbi:MAG: YciK family oxidoreductase [Acidobacteriota bacterium]|nr:MAG: YciK family oxidoreductase [Acidobacteriota bacterium]